MLSEMIIIDLETGGLNVTDGIYEVAALAIKDGIIVDELHIGTVLNASEIHLGYGAGYDDISTNANSIEDLKSFLEMYPYPLVAHNGAFDKKFLTYFNWIPTDYPFYDSIRAFRIKAPALFSYSLTTLIDFFDLDLTQQHTATTDVKILYTLIEQIQPDIWIPIGQSLHSKSNKLASINIPFDIIKDTFIGKNIVFTGKGPYIRNDLIQLAKKCGAEITSNSITKKTNLLIVGDGAGSKLQKAHDLGIEIMDMADFFEMTSGIELDNQTTGNTRTSNSAILPDVFKGETISFVPMRASMSQKLSALVERYGGTTTTRLNKNTTILVYQLSFMNHEDNFASIAKARERGIQVLTLGHFNRLFLEKTSQL